MKIGVIISVIGALLVMLFVFANLGMYLIGGANPQWAGFLLLMAIAAGVGALPGLMINLRSSKKKDCQADQPPA